MAVEHATTSTHSARKDKADRVFGVSLIGSLLINGILWMVASHSGLFAAPRGVDQTRHFAIFVYRPETRPVSPRTLRATPRPTVRQNEPQTAAQPRVQSPPAFTTIVPVPVRPAPAQIRPAHASYRPVASVAQPAAESPPAQAILSRPQDPAPRAASLIRQSPVSVPTPTAARAPAAEPPAARIEPAEQIPMPTPPSAAVSPVQTETQRPPPPSPVPGAARPNLESAGPPPAKASVAEPDRNTPEIIGSFDEITLPGFDPTTIDVSSVQVTWEVDERGRVSSVKFKPTGNEDVDSAIRHAVEGFRFKPRVVDGKPQPATLTHTFDLGG